MWFPCDNYLKLFPHEIKRNKLYSKTEEYPCYNIFDELDATSLKWMNQLIAPGSSLGGAHHKADVVDANGKQWIAKFPSKKDDSDVGLWEMIVRHWPFKL